MMSLVAGYGSDSDEESEERNTDYLQETVQKLSSKSSSKIDKVETKEEVLNIEDEDEWQSGISTEISAVKSNLFSLLPQPKDSTLIVAEELDDEFICKKPLTSSVIHNNKNLSIGNPTGLNLPAPPKGKKKQPVKILIPTLKGVDSDSDDDESPAQSAPTSKKNSTLFSMLPKPRHTVTVGENKNRVFEKEKNRSFVPHTLTKKVIGKNVVEKKALINKVSVEKEEDEEDDDDDMSGNFFSLISNTEQKGGDTEIEDTEQKGAGIEIEGTWNDSKIKIKQMEKIDNTENKLVTHNTKGNDYFASLFKSDIVKNREDSKVTENTSSTRRTEENSAVISDADKKQSNVVNKTFNDLTAPYSEVTEPYENVTKPYVGVTTPYVNMTEPYSEVTESYANVRSSYGNTIESQHCEGERDVSSSNNFFRYAYKDKDVETTSAVDYYNQPNEDQALDNKALTALLGRKRLREDVNIIDINADDIQGNSQDHLKNLTKESSYRPKQAKSSQPNRQQRNKHQITYLAFQAREREHELRQSWADNRQTKRQTQSKYGF